MLDIKLIRTNPDLVKANIKKREMNLDHTVDEILDIDAKRRELTGTVEAMKAERNADTKKIPQMKKAGEDTTELMAKMKALADQIKEADAQLGQLEEKQQDLMLSLPICPTRTWWPAARSRTCPCTISASSPSLILKPRTMWTCARAWA